MSALDLSVHYCRDAINRVSTILKFQNHGREYAYLKNNRKHLNYSMDLYDKIILDLNRNPPNFMVRDNVEHEVEAYNSYCGDKFKLQMDVKRHVETVTFQGFGCAVSKASTAILTECAQGRSWQEIHDICVLVLKFLNGREENIVLIDKRLSSFAIVHKIPGRYDCAALCWEEMRKYCSSQIELRTKSDVSDCKD